MLSFTVYISQKRVSSEGTLTWGKHFFCFFFVISFANEAGPRWNNSIYIDDHNLTINVAAEQCQKSLINAPKSWNYGVKKPLIWVLGEV
jgi:hypothetical protein